MQLIFNASTRPVTVINRLRRTPTVKGRPCRPWIDSRIIENCFRRDTVLRSLSPGGVNELESHYAGLSRPVSSAWRVARVCVSDLINQRLSYCVVDNETMTRVNRFPLILQYGNIYCRAEIIALNWDNKNNTARLFLCLFRYFW